MTTEVTREELDRMQGAVVVEFGAPWCPICQGARPLIDRALSERTDVRYFRIEDGKGRPLGRSFRVKLWPTLVVLRDGREVARVVRPTDAETVSRAFAELDAPPAPA